MPQIQVLPLAPRQQQPSFGSLLGEQLGSGVGAGISSALQNFLAQKQNQQLQSQLEEAGVPQELASLFPKVPQGAKTAIVQKGLEMGERGMLGNPEVGIEEEIDVLPSQDRGLTAKERVRREESRYGKNIEALEASKSKYDNLVKENLSLEQLETLNESGKLPKNFGRLNINPKSGELLLPFASNPETQLFVKTINDFTTKAKESFGARVTNFELERFMSRLPTLLNSEEGRELILRQMKIINEIDQAHANSLQNAFDKAGGARRLDLDQARKVADKLSKKKVGDLIESYKNIDKKLDKIKPDSVKKGTKARNPETGETLVWTGSEWKPLK